MTCTQLSDVVKKMCKKWDTNSIIIYCQDSDTILTIWERKAIIEHNSNPPSFFTNLQSFFRLRYNQNS